MKVQLNVRNAWKGIHLMEQDVQSVQHPTAFHVYRQNRAHAQSVGKDTFSLTRPANPATETIVSNAMRTHALSSRIPPNKFHSA